MRQVGTITEQAQAHRFAAYLVTQGVATHAEQEPSGWAIWVRDENHLDQAKQELEDFLRAPDDARYQGAEQKAESLLREQLKRQENAGKNVVEMGGKWKRPGAAGGQMHRPLTMAMIGLSIVVAIGSSLGENKSGAVMRNLLFADTMQGPDWDVSSTQDRFINIREGQVWRLVTPIFVHYGIMHIVFNMYMFYQLGGIVEHRLGTVKFGFMVLAMAIPSVLVQSLAPLEWHDSMLGRWGGSPFGAGMSGVVYGLFGYVWMKSKFDPAAGFFLGPYTVMILMGWLLLGVTGIVGNIGNWAHLIGLVVGMAIGYSTSLSTRVKR